MSKVVDALKANGLYDNSIIVFSTDNGGGASPSAVYPWKGGKETFYERGVRAVGWVHSPHLEKTNTEISQRIFISDWFATLLTVAGLESQVPSHVDSYNVWPTLSWGRKSPRKEIVLNLDEDTYWNTWSAAIIKGKYKFIWGQRKLLRHHLEEERCSQELYNLEVDPKEENNLMEKGVGRKLVARIKDRLLEHYPRMVRGNLLRASIAGLTHPSRFNGVLSSGWC